MMRLPSLIATVAFLLVQPFAAVVHAEPAQGSTITVAASVGWNNEYRAIGTSVPVRATVHNAGERALQGWMEVDAPSVTDPLLLRPQKDVHYRAPLVVPPGATADVSLYLPGDALSNATTVDVVAGNRRVASQTVFPHILPDDDIVIGTLTSDPSVTQWVGRARERHLHFVSLELQPADLTPRPGGLATFDEIVLSNFNASVLDTDQTFALERFVQQGGTLLLVGGSDWQETLGPLPAALIPGRLAGALSVDNLDALSFFGTGAPPRGATTLTMLSGANGVAIPAWTHAPLVVRAADGLGRLEFLAFDPAEGPLSTWPGGPDLFARLLTAAVPTATRRATLPVGFDDWSFANPTPGRMDISTQSLGAAPLPVPALAVTFGVLIALSLLYLLALGPCAFLLTRRGRRTGRAWLILPAMGVVSALGLTWLVPHSDARPLSVGAAGAIAVLGPDGSALDDTYLRLLSAHSSPSTISVTAPALALGVPPPVADGSAAHWQIDEGAQTSVQLPNLPVGMPRTTLIRRSITLPGRITARLTLSPDGLIVGTIHNGLSLTLRHPAIIAGDAAADLHAVAPGATLTVRVRPDADVLRNGYGNPLIGLYGGGSDGAAIRNAVLSLPEASTLPMLGNLMLAGWLGRPIAPAAVDGRPVQQGLSLLVQLLTVRIPRHDVTLRPGTVDALPLSIVPVVPQYACCNPSLQGIFLGGGGEATFAFDLGARDIRATRLTLSAFAGGPDTTYNGYTDMPEHALSVFDWRDSRWVDQTFRHAQTVLSNPNRFIGPNGAVLVRIRASSRTGDLEIFDPYHDLQLSGQIRSG